jgi:hypothetical protein
VKQLALFRPLDQELDRRMRSVAQITTARSISTRGS